MKTILIEENSLQAKELLEYIKTLPYAIVLDSENKTFHEAAEECKAVSVDNFFNELDERIKNHFKQKQIINDC